VSSSEIRALKREIALAQDKNENLTRAYDELKQEHEAMIFARDTDSERLAREHAKQMKAAEKQCLDLGAEIRSL